MNRVKASISLKRRAAVLCAGLCVAVPMRAWASGRSWAEVVQDSGQAEGDLAMLIARTADNLRHIRTLGAVFPRVAATAGHAVELIMREPVTWHR